jgi:hypothetical protein
MEIRRSDLKALGVRLILFRSDSRMPPRKLIVTGAPRPCLSVIPTEAERSRLAARRSEPFLRTRDARLQRART